MTTWNEVERFLLAEATRNLQATGDVIPCLAAFHDDELLFTALWRPFAKGDHSVPFIELSALACPLDANRLALSIGARVWSLEDPIPPVLPEGDLRQRALCVHSADATVRPTGRAGAMFPFDIGAGGVSWGDPVREAPRGPLADAVVIAVERRKALRAPLSAIRAQARRCRMLGHQVDLAPAVAERLALAAHA